MISFIWSNLFRPQITCSTCLKSSAVQRDIDGLLSSLVLDFYSTTRFPASFTPISNISMSEMTSSMIPVSLFSSIKQNCWLSVKIIFKKSTIILNISLSCHNILPLQKRSHHSSSRISCDLGRTCLSKQNLETKCRSCIESLGNCFVLYWRLGNQLIYKLQSNKVLG